MDRFSPVAPATIRVQVVPASTIERKRFGEVLQTLQSNASSVRLSDLDDDSLCLLSPKTAPDGTSLLVNYTTASVSEGQEQLSPYELFREPQIVLGVVAEGNELHNALERLRKQHSRAVHHHILLLPDADTGTAADSNNVTRVAKTRAGNESLLAYRDAMTEVLCRYLMDLSTFAQALQASPTIPTPTQPYRAAYNSVLRRSDERQPDSGHATPTQTAEIASPVDDTSRPPSRNFRSPPPATSFEQMQGTHTAPSALARSDSGASTRGDKKRRSDSQERASSNGPAISQRKAKERGKARVGIVLGHIHMMAGRWNHALRTLAEHTTAARKYNDALWQAKGLEGIVVCMILLSWAGLEFQIPSICFSPAEQNTSGHASKLSINLPADFRPTEAAHQAAVRKLSTNLPDLLANIILLYSQTEGAMQLPVLVTSELCIRLCSILAELYHTNGELNKDVLAKLVENKNSPGPIRPLGAGLSSRNLSKTVIGDVVRGAAPNEEDGLAPTDDEQIMLGSYRVLERLGMHRKGGIMLENAIRRLAAALNHARMAGAAEAGIHPAASLSSDSNAADALAQIGNQISGVEDLVRRMADIFGLEILLPNTENTGDTPVHKTENDSTDDIFNMDGLEESLPSIEDTAVNETEDDPDDPFALDLKDGTLTYDRRTFGNPVLKAEVLGAIIAYFEAAPDPQGVLSTTASLMRAATPFAAVDHLGNSPSIALLKEDQIRAVQAIIKTNGYIHWTGHPGIWHHFWDPFLVRGLNFEALDDTHLLFSKSSAPARGTTPGAQNAPAGPLLYDPNASRAETGVASRVALLRTEPRRVYVTFQNPSMAPITINSIEFVTEGQKDIKLECKDSTMFTLAPQVFQQIPFLVAPTALGEFNITGCRIQVLGCEERLFRIFEEPWALTQDFLVKSIGQEKAHLFRPGTDGVAKHTIVPAECVMSMPMLELDSVSKADTTIAMLEGEEHTVSLSIRNPSCTPAVINGVTDAEGVFAVFQDRDAASDSSEEVVGAVGDEWTDKIATIPPGGVTNLKLKATGKLGVSQLSVAIRYRPAPYNRVDAHFRVLSVTFQITVAPVIQLRNAKLVDANPSSFTLSFDVRSMWQTFVMYQCDRLWTEPSIEESLMPGDVRRVTISVRKVDLAKAESAAQVLEKLRKLIQVHWSLHGGRHGLADLRSLLPKEDLQKMLKVHFRMRVELEKRYVEMGGFVRVRIRVVNNMHNESRGGVVDLRCPQGDRRVNIASAPKDLPRLAANTEKVLEWQLCAMTTGETDLQAFWRVEGEKDEDLMAEAQLVIGKSKDDLLA